MDAKAIRLTFLAATLGLFCAVCPGRQTLSSVALAGVDAPLAEETPADPNMAHHPLPADGAIHEATWASLAWSPGRHGDSHNVYFSDNFDDVNDGVDKAFLGKQTETFRPVGFGTYLDPTGLIPGTTYYWRVDEVNDLHPDSPWRGEIWSFTITPRTAYDPIPADGNDLVDPNVTLEWKAGFGAKSHIVYFGDNFDDVNTAIAGLPQQTTTFAPGPLELGKTYYWRVDELDGLFTHRGDVWSFTTVPLTASNPDPPDGAVLENPWAVLSWSPGYYAASHDVYASMSFEDVNVGTSGAFRRNQSVTFHPIGFPEFGFPYLMPPGTTHYWRIDEVNELHPDSPWRGDIWSFTVAPKTAYDPAPADGNDLVDPNVTLEWKAGLRADLHIVYFGDNFDDVNTAVGGLPLETTTYNPGSLELGKTYYWRVDEFDGWFLHRGEVWSFTTVPLIASNPDPPDGAIHDLIWAVLSWSPGYYADSHDLYISRSRDDVASGSDKASWPNHSDAFAIIGLCDYTGWSMGIMQPGATVYWRVDEVNDLHPDSPWKGDVWSFTIQTEP
ncbi:MAG: fibronectin type III domain-containing protein [Planctomycetota bacterium]|jgi:hypothetical protein